MGRLAGKVALITGAGAGIGKQAALLFAREGAAVAVAELREDTAEATVAAIHAEGGRAIALACDVSGESAVAATVQKAVAEFGRLDVLYNNVGGTNPADGPAVSVPLDVLWSTLQRDLFGTFLFCRFGIPEIIRGGGGSVINTASLVALIGKPRPAQDCYTIAKGGIISFTRSLAVHHAPDGVRVNAISPGVTATERLVGRIAEGAIPKAFAARHLLGLLEPIDIAYTALYLASDESRMVTGQILPVDSGMTMT